MPESPVPKHLILLTTSGGVHALYSMREKNASAVSNPTAVKCLLGLESKVLAKNVSYNSRHSYSAAQVSSSSITITALSHHEAEDVLIDSRDSKIVCSGGTAPGILYKWVNYGKGWRSRWFMLEDGVLSYYKVHGPDRVLMSSGKKFVKVIGEESIKFVRKNSSENNRLSVSAKRGKPFGKVDLKVSSVRASKSDDKCLSIFSGTKALHLRSVTKEDRAAWIEALLAAKDLFPKALTNNDVALAEEIILRMVQEGIGEEIIKDCESIMLTEVSELQNQLKALHHEHLELMNSLKQLEAEKIELETTVVDETKGRDSCCGQGIRRFSDFYSIMSEGSGINFDADNVSQCGADAENDEDDGAFFDTNDYLASEFIRSASCRSRDSVGNGCSSMMHETPSSFPNQSQELQMGIRLVKYPYVNRRDSLPDPKEKDKPIGMWSIIKDNIGKDLSGVCLPVYFNEPLSSLQKCFEDLEYSGLVDQASEWGKKGILKVATFAVSGYASIEGRQCKPFNPLLGETYEADYPDKGLRFFSEKVLKPNA
ncbi:hypothetical protein V2J09_003855 [Rumex salicifolius]